MSYADTAAISEHMAEVIPLTRSQAPRQMTDEEFEEWNAPRAEPSSEHDAAPNGEEIPAHLLEVPGLVGHLTRWITKTALYPQPGLSLGAALALVGTAAGRKYAGPTKSGTHLYVLGLAGTGSGKNHPAKQAKRILRACQMEDLLGPGQFMSESAVYQYVAAQPQMLCFMDEFGSYLQRINSPKGASGYERAISGALRSLWGASFDEIRPPAWAASSGRDRLKPIQSPALSIYGMSVHDEFFQALQSADIANGFLNRFLILSTQRKPDEVEPELDEDVIPAPLVAMMQYVGRSAYDASRPCGATDAWTAEIRMDWETADARLAYRGFRESLDGRGEESKLLSRVPEMAVRLATIRAIGRGAAKQTLGVPRVNTDDIVWGCDLAMWSANRMIEDTKAYMVESEHQGRVLEVVRYLKAAPGGRLTHTELSRKVKHKYDSRVLKAILDSLLDTDQIEVARAPMNGAKKPTDCIRLKGGE